jgi:hypothetical protein
MHSQRQECVIHVGQAIEKPESLSTNELEEIIKQQLATDIASGDRQ